MPRKAKTEETVVTEENILTEESMETGGMPDMEGTDMDTENPDAGSAPVDVGSPSPEETDVKNAPTHGTDDTCDTPVTENTDIEETAPASEEPASPEDGTGAETAPVTEPAPRPAAARRRTKGSASAAKAASVPDTSAPIKKTAPSSILTLSADTEVETPESREDTIWHELQNAYRTRKILTGSLGGIEKMDGGGTIAVIYYKEMRVVIPLAEMMINLVEDETHDYGELVQRQNKILGNMLGCEIDFIIKGLDNASRSVVASRKDAMYKKRQIFYMPDADGNSRVCEDRIVQARVIAVAEKVVRVEIFGTECSILARDLSWDWLGDATERFHVGEQILVRILSVKVHSLEDISVKADVKSVNGNTSKENLTKCKIQGKYAGTVTDIHKGTVFVRLHIGVNAVAHSCYDNRMPGKKDEVSFVVTRIDADRNVAVGLISRIIKQNI